MASRVRRGWMSGRKSRVRNTSIFNIIRYRVSSIDIDTTNLPACYIITVACLYVVCEITTSAFCEYGTLNTTDSLFLVISL